MSGAKDVHGSEREFVVEQGETYDHTEHGRVKVTGIWKGVHQVDRARNAEETGVIIVRYSTEKDGGVTDVTELTDTLADFLEAVDGSAPV